MTAARPPRSTDVGVGSTELRDAATGDRVTRTFGNGYGLHVGDRRPAYRLSAVRYLVPAIEGANDTEP